MLFCKCLLMASAVLFLNPSSMPMLTSASIPTTMKELNVSTALSCNRTCPGLMQWKRGAERVAQCGPGAKTDLMFTCESTQDKNILTVPQVNFSTAGYYTAFCDNAEKGDCRQLLKVIPPEFDLELRAGEHLRLDLHNLKTALISFTKPGNSSRVELCRVEEGCLRCRAEYQERVFVSNVLKIMDMKLSDTGNYSVQDQYGELVSSSYVTVKDVRQNESAGYWQSFCAGALIFAFVTPFLVGFLDRFVVPRVIYQIRKTVQRFRKRNRMKNEDDDNMANENGTVPLKDNTDSVIEV